MSKKKIGGIVAVVAILIGLLMVLLVLVKIGFDLRNLNTETFRYAEHRLEGEFSEIEIESSFFDVKLLPVAEEEEGVAYLPYSDKITHSFTVQNGKLTIRVQDDRAWYEKWLFEGTFDERIAVELHLPRAHYEKLTVDVNSGDVVVNGQLDGESLLSFENVLLKTSSGDLDFRAEMQNSGNGMLNMQTISGNVTMAGVSGVPIELKTTSGDILAMNSTPAQSIRLASTSGHVKVMQVTMAEDGVLSADVSSGEIELSNVRVGTMKLEITSGDIELSNVMVAGELRAETNSGDIEIKRSDAGSLYLETTSGDVEAELLTGKMFEVDTTSGDKRYPASDRDGGLCKVKTTSGDVDIVVLAR